MISHRHGKAQQVVGQTIFGVKTSQFTGSRCAVLAEDMDQAFPASNAEQKQHAPPFFGKAFVKQLSKAL